MWAVEESPWRSHARWVGAPNDCKLDEPRGLRRAAYLRPPLRGVVWDEFVLRRAFSSAGGAWSNDSLCTHPPIRPTPPPVDNMPAAMPLEIKPGDLGQSDVQELLAAHLAFARAESPAESAHALDLSGLRAPDIAFWTAREDGLLLACGALRELDREHGEVKSMHTRAAVRGRGYGARMLEYLVTESRRRGYRRLSLETGTAAAFDSARALYTRFGFRECTPFGSYRKDSSSLRMTLPLR